MSWFTRMMEDAAPKADAVKRITSKTGNALINNCVVDTAGKLGYKAAVNTVGVACVLSAPAVKKLGEKAHSLKAWASEEPKK